MAKAKEVEQNEVNKKSEMPPFTVMSNVIANEDGTVSFEEIKSE